MTPMTILGIYLLLRSIACTIIHIQWTRQRTHVKPDSLDSFVSLVIILLSFELFVISIAVDAVKLRSQRSTR